MVLLNRPYAGYAAGTIVQLPTNVEASLISQGFAVNSAGPVTAGAVTTTQSSGRVAVAAGQSSVVVTNPAVNGESKIYAVVAQSTADTTFTSVVRVVPAAGFFTIFGPANATAATTIDWILMQQSGDTPPVNTL